MAEKAGDIIKDALKELSVHGSESSLDPSEAKDAVRYLNRMMSMLSAKGINLGFTELTGTGSTMTTPLAANEGIVYLLALKLWGQYSEDGAPVPVVLMENARKGLEDLIHIGFDVGSSEFPSTLPIGSGNEGDYGYGVSHFYDDLQDTILTEFSGSIALESGTP